MRVKAALLAGVCAGFTAFPAVAQDAVGDDLEDPQINSNTIIVTAQRQAQSLQEVPIAVSAFDAEALEAQQIENASDLQLTLPNVTFTKGNFTGSSFTIRGIGDLCVGTTCDAATGIHTNGSPLFGTRLFETEYFDLERVEVLRGPQGTLFGRNATSGVVNIVTAKPDLSGFAAAAEFEYGNYDSMKAKGMVNIPIGNSIGARVAGFWLKRDGFTTNIYDGNDIDDRDMYAIRGSLRFEPGPSTTLDLMGYYFRENDNRLRIQKQQCQRDPRLSRQPSRFRQYEHQFDLHRHPGFGRIPPAQRSAGRLRPQQPVRPGYLLQLRRAGRCPYRGYGLHARIFCR